MKRQLGPASRSLDISSPAKAGLVVIAIVVAASSGCNELSRSEIRSETADAVQKQTDDMRSLREVDPKLVKYRQIAEIKTDLRGTRGIAVSKRQVSRFAPQDFLYVTSEQGIGDFYISGTLSMLPEFGAYCIATEGRDGAEIRWVGYKDHVRVEKPGTSSGSGPVWVSLGPDAYVTSIAVRANDVFVADAGNRVVLHYSKSGELLGKIGQKDEGKGIPGLVVPSPHLDVATSKDGMVLVTNPGRRRVEIYNKDGELQSHWGKASQEIDGFCGCCNPTDIAILPDGRIVTSEKGLPRVKVYSPDGKFESVVATPDDFSAKAAGLDLAVSDDGRVFVLDPPAGVVRVFAEKTQIGPEEE